MSDIWQQADTVGKGAANNITEDDIGRRCEPFLYFFTTRETVSYGKELKARGNQPLKMAGRTSYRLLTPMYRTFEEAWAYAEAAAEFLMKAGMDINYGVWHTDEYRTSVKMISRNDKHSSG